MSKRNNQKSQASSSRAVGSTSGFGGFGGAVPSNTLSYLGESANLLTISDPNVVVSFKNLSKKDSTTKTKGVEDLRAYIEAHPYENGGGVEDPILEAWVCQYPRLSIDNSRRVRELSHATLCDLLKSARKRMEKHIPKIAGAWLAGLYDKDRAVSRTATNTLTSFLDTNAKVLFLKKQCQGAILEYVQDAINETPETLSDERATTEEDRQEKYNRVISSSLSLITSLLTSLSQDDISKHQDKYEGLVLDNQIVWSSAASKDASVRRAVYELLVACLDHQPDMIEGSLKVIGSNLVGKALRTSQSTTASSLLSALARLSAAYPQIWTPTITVTKSGLPKILKSFMSKGSQSCNEQYWNLLLELFKVLPKTLLGADAETSVSTLAALQEGINHKSTISSHLGAAWASYAGIGDILVSNLPDSMSSVQFCESSIYPLFEKWLSGTMVGPSTVLTGCLAKLYDICASLSGDEADKSFANVWQRLGEQIITSIQTSLPEQSQGYKESQDSVTAQGHKWFLFAAEIISAEKNSSYIMSPSTKILISALSTIKSRNGKPYSAAAVAEAGLRSVPAFSRDADIQSATEEVLTTSFSQLMTSSSATHIVSIFQHMGAAAKDRSLYCESWDQAIDGILAMPNGQPKSQGIAALISLEKKISNAQEAKNSEVASFIDEISHAARSHSPLQEYFVKQTEIVMSGNTEPLPVLRQALIFNALDSNSEGRLVEHALSNLFTSHFSEAFNILDLLFRNKPVLLQSEEIQTMLVVKLLSLAELTSRGDNKEAALRNIIDTLSSGTGGNETQQNAVVQAIRFGLLGQTEMSTTALIKHAKGLLSQNTDYKIYDDLLPDLALWAKGLVPLLLKAPDFSLGLMRPFSGAVFLAREPEKDVSKEILYLLNPLQKSPVGVDLQTGSLARDRQGLSMPLRMAIYALGVFSHIKFFDILSQGQQITLIRLLALTRELVNDQVDLVEENKLYGTNENAEALALVRQYVSDYKVFLDGIVLKCKGWSWRDGSEQDQHSVPRTIHTLVNNLLQDTSNTKPKVYAYYSSRVLGRVLEALCAVQAWKSDGGEQWLSTVGVLKSTSTDHFAVEAIFVGIDDGLLDSKLTNTFCNRLVSDLADAKPDSPNTLEKLVLLNSCLDIYLDSVPVAKNRLMFAIKNMISWTPGLEMTNKPLASEVCRALQLLLPATSDMFGSHWEAALDFCVSIWTSNAENVLSKESVSMIGMSLKLYSILRKMVEPNDDLQEALGEHSKDIVDGLISVLKLERKKMTVPVLYIDELLSRMLQTLPPRPISELSDLYPLIASNYPLIQTAAYTLLDRSLSEAQQQISVDVLLEKKDAQLPVELLSLLLEVPSVHDFSESEIENFPPAFRRYLLSWHLVFQSFATASNKVRDDYTKILKSDDYIGPLLILIADILGHSVANALDLGTAAIDPEMRRHYDMKTAENESGEKNMHWLLSNLYCLALIRTPMLVKSWWTDCSSRATKIAYEQWTERFFTPIVVAEHLGEVQAWADAQDPPADEKELIVTTSVRSRDIFAGYEIDDMQAQFNIQLPTNYPLQPVAVKSINRVGCSEKKWQSFMITTQAVISFSDGSITEGLSTFRRNMVAMLKGHTECAICYSIISSDKKTPDKKCSTCSNLFHSKCLYTWFQSSSQSTCPLCRNPFQYSSGARG